LQLIGREIRRFTSQLVERAEMRRARDYLIGQIDLSLESPETRMMWLGEQWLTFGKVMLPDQIKNNLAGVTATQVRAAARDFFRPERLNLAIVSPLKKDRGLIRSLQLN
jgi:predicted Zn-dependent peptidase